MPAKMTKRNFTKLDAEHCANLNRIYNDWVAMDEDRHTQVYLATLMQRSGPLINGYLHGTRPMKEAIIKEFALALGCLPQDIAPSLFDGSLFTSTVGSIPVEGYEQLNEDEKSFLVNWIRLRNRHKS